MIVRHRYPVRNFDQAFEQLTRSFFDGPARPSGPAVSARWDDDTYVLTVDLPGVPADAVTVDVVGDQLRLAASTEGLTFERKLRLSDRLDGEKVSANHVDGRLTVRIGKVDEPETRSVTIDTTPAPAAIEASADEESADEESAADAEATADES